MIELFKINPDIIDEIQLKCNDHFFEDFDRPIYLSAIFWAMKKVANKYDILERLHKLKGDVPNEEDINKPLFLELTSFRNESAVFVNNIRYEKIDNKDPWKENTYQLYYRDQNWALDYFPRKQVGDLIDIYYTADLQLPDLESERTIPILPGKFNPEIIKRATSIIAESGVAKFTGEKKQKYVDILRLINSRFSDASDSKISNKVVITQKIFDYP